MTPAEHLAEAERIMTRTVNARQEISGWDAQVNLATAQSHALIALAAQLGVPHQHLAGGGGDTGGA